MSLSPALALQVALVSTLKGATDAGANVFDRVPEADPFPRITVGEIQELDNAYDCYEGTESYLTINVFSRKVGYPEVKRIADQVRQLVNDTMVVDGHTLELIKFESAEYQREDDGLTSRAIITFRALTQPSGTTD